MSEIPSSKNWPSPKSGRIVVAGMFFFGILTTGLLYAYWTLHLTPFMPLQEAIVAEYPGSAPRVDGGQRKMHKDTPGILRVVMKTQFDPSRADPKTVNAIHSLQLRIHELVKTKVDFPAMRFIELHVYHLQQEKAIRERSFRRDLYTDGEWIEIAEDGTPVNAAREPDSMTSEVHDPTFETSVENRAAQDAVTETAP